MKKKMLWIMCGVLALLLLIAVIVWTQLYKSNTYYEQLDLGEKYLAELDYENAELCYRKAIEIKEKEIKPYIQLSNVYVAQNDFEDAKTIMEQAQKIDEKYHDNQYEKVLSRQVKYIEETALALGEIIGTSEDEIQEMTETPTPEPEETTDPLEEMYQAYAEKITSYEAQYGEAAVWSADYMSYMTGLCFMKLVDFNQNGEEELLLVYQTDVQLANVSYRDYTFEVWKYAKGSMDMLDTGKLFGTNGGVSTVYLANYNGKIYLVEGGEDAFGYYTYHGYTDDGFGIAKEISWEDTADGQIVGAIDGISVSYETVQAENAKWFGNVEDYNLNYDCERVVQQNAETKALCNIIK